jgi:hypothetical protein
MRDNAHDTAKEDSTWSIGGFWPMLGGPRDAGCWCGILVLLVTVAYCFPF